MSTEQQGPADTSAVIHFGSDNRFTEVSIGAVAGRDIHNVSNTVLNPAPPPRVVSHATPPVAPRPIRDFLDRDAEQQALAAELRPGGGAWLSGPAGCGITALLRQVAGQVADELFPDGVGYLDGSALAARYGREPSGRLAADDLGQALFDCFFQLEDPTRRAYVGLSQALPYLRGLTALVVLDHLVVERDILIELGDNLVRSAFVLAAPSPAPDTLLDLQLTGLAPAEARALFATTAAAASDLPAVGEVAAALEHVPLALVLSGRLVRQGRISLTELSARLAAPHTNGAPLERTLQVALTCLSDAEQAVLRAVAATGNPVTPSLLAASAEQAAETLPPVLAQLAALGLVVASGEHYRAATPSVQAALASLLRPVAERQRLATAYAALVVTRPEQLAVGDLAATARAAGDLLLQGEAARAAALAQQLHPALVLGRQWTLWQQTVAVAEQAAHQLGDAQLLAWARHEYGVYAGLGGNLAAASTALNAALQSRRATGDRASAAVTRQALRQLGLTAPPVFTAGWKPLAAGIGLAAVVGLGGVILGANQPEPGSATATAVAVLPTASATGTPTPTYTSTVTPTSTPTPTLTATPTPTPMPATLNILADARLERLLASFAEAYTTDDPARVTLSRSIDPAADIVDSVRSDPAIDVLVIGRAMRDTILQSGLIDRTDIVFLGCSDDVQSPPAALRTDNYTVIPLRNAVHYAEARLYAQLLQRWVADRCSTVPAYPVPVPVQTLVVPDGVLAPPPTRTREPIP